MAVKIRLKRLGRKKKPVYRVVVAESSNPRDGKTIENIGSYNPTVDPIIFEVDQDRAKHWLSVGAQPTDTVRRLMGNIGLVEKVQKNNTKKPRKESSETE